MNTRLRSQLFNPWLRHALRTIQFGILGSALLATSGAWAQQTTAPEPLPAKFLPTSPTVGTIQRFDKQQNVNLITGAAQASVPVAELHSGPLHTAVTLNYSFGGLKVFQSQDLVGLGWSLQAGGVISRHIVGRPDDQQDGYGRYNSDSVARSHPSFLRTAYNGEADPSPDVYDFTAGSVHGRFLVQDTTVVMLPKQPLEIRRLHDGSGFQIATETEGRYIFRNAEVTEPNVHNFGKLGIHTSAWQLTEIISHGNTDTIRFYYSVRDYQEARRIAQTSLQVLAFINSTPVNYLENGPANSYVYGSKIHMQVLDSISTRGARVLIRRDNQLVMQRVITLSTVRGARRVINVVELGHSTFAGSGTQAERRLRLDWVQQRNGALRLTPYRFAYDTTFALPPTTSKGLDHWGYYNGADQNGATNASSALLPHPLLQVDGLSPDREPHFEFAQLGALRRITYPTGGYTTFTYEPNRYSVPVKYKNVPIIKGLEAFLSSPLHLDASRLKPTNYRGLADLAGDSAVFSLTQIDTVKFSLFVKPLLENNANFLDKRVSFLLLKRGNTSDSVVFANVGIANETRRWNLELLPGSYVAWVLSEPLARYGDTFAEDGNSLTVSLPHRVYLPDVAGNGIRVQQVVTTTNGALPLTRAYSYLRQDSAGTYSSGTMLLPITAAGQPIYESKMFRVIASSQTVMKDYWNYTSDNTKFGDEYNKYSFYYSCVTEQEIGEAGKPAGKKVYQYRHYPKAFNDVMLVKTTTYQLVGNDLSEFNPLMVERNFYSYDVNNVPLFATARPYKLGMIEGNIALLGEDYGYRADYYSYALGSPSLALDTTVSVRYGATDSLVTESHTTYAQQHPVRTTTRDSHGTQHITTISYLSDYALTLANISQFRRYNFNPIIEVQHWRRLVGHTDSLLVGADVTLYNPQWLQPDSVWRLAVAQPLNAQPLANRRYNLWLRQMPYQLTATEQYAPVTGDPIGHKATAGAATAYIWGYERTALVAQVQNATPAQVAYTGFEAGEMGRWQGTRTAIAAPGRTGDAGYDLTGGLACHGLPPGNYRLSCHQQGTAGITANGQVLTPTGPAKAGWTEYTATISIGTGGSVQLVGAGRVDDVRLHPVGARMTSYTHDPLVGETSQTDPSGRTTFYEYDVLGRLVRTRDEQGRILSQQQYHYARH